VIDALSLLRKLTARGIRLIADPPRLIAKPASLLTEDDCTLIRAHRAALLDLLKAGNGEAKVPPPADDRIICGRCELKNPRDRKLCYHCLALLDPEITPKIKAIEPLARSLGWHPHDLWDAPHGLAEVLAAEDEIGAVETDYIEILKTTHDLQRFYRKH
jgi:hypothetical protein